MLGRGEVKVLDRSGVAQAQLAQGVEVVALDNQVFMRGVATAKRRVQVQGHEVVVIPLVVLDFIPFPHQAEFRLAVPLPQQAHQFLLAVFVVFVCNGIQLKKRPRV